MPGEKHTPFNIVPAPPPPLLSRQNVKLSLFITVLLLFRSILFVCVRARVCVNVSLLSIWHFSVFALESDGDGKRRNLTTPDRLGGESFYRLFVCFLIGLPEGRQKCQTHFIPCFR